MWLLATAIFGRRRRFGESPAGIFPNRSRAADLLLFSAACNSNPTRKRWPSLTRRVTMGAASSTCAHFSISATLAYASRYYGGRGNANPAPEVPRLFKLLMREHLGRVGSSRDARGRR